MTPAGATAAARRAAGARRTARARGRAETAPASPRVVPRAPRRVSGPGRRAAPRRGRVPWTARALAALRAMPDHVIVDRLTRGRLWIGLIGCLLLGLVSMQVALLKLNAGIGRAVQQSANLERRNGELRAEISRLGSEERIQAMGARLGLVMPDAGSVTYLGVRRGQDAASASQALRSNQLGRNAAAAQAQAQAQAQTQSGAQPATGAATDPASTTDPSAASSSPADQAASGDQAAPNATGAGAGPAAAADGSGAQG